jgi:type I restriction enzyme M protein
LPNDHELERISDHSGSELGLDPETLWQAADKLRGSIDAAEYKHVVLGLIFLKYISDAFETRRRKLADELDIDGIKGPEAERLLESRDEYTAENIFGAARSAMGQHPEPGNAAQHRQTHR